MNRYLATVAMIESFKSFGRVNLRAVQDYMIKSSFGEKWSQHGTYNNGVYLVSPLYVKKIEGGVLNIEIELSTFSFTKSFYILGTIHKYECIYSNVVENPGIGIVYVGDLKNSKMQIEMLMHLIFEFNENSRILGKTIDLVCIDSLVDGAELSHLELIKRVSS